MKNGGIDMSITRFNIADVARIHGIRILQEKSGETYAVCPFCGDKRGKFSYIIKKGNRQNMYHCFACESGGNAVELHMKLSTKNYDRIKNGYKVATRDIFKAIQGNTILESQHVEIEHVESEDEIEKCSDEYCSNVYHAMLNELRLLDNHKNDLLKRGLPQQDIDNYNFRSTPKYNGRQICENLIKKGFSLEGVPGFHKQKGVWEMSIPGIGYFCPCIDGEMNYLEGFQIRMDKPVRDAKYLWFSSAGKTDGITSGALATYLPGEYEKCIIIVEGILKALIVYCLLDKKVTVIGVPGVGNIKSLEPYLARHENNAFVIEAYDMDKKYNISDIPLLKKAEKIAKEKNISLDELFNMEEYKTEFKKLIKARRIDKAAIALRQKVEEYGIEVHPLKWDMDGDYWKGEFKGPDDFLASYPDKEKFLNYILRKADASLKMKRYFSQCV